MSRIRLVVLAAMTVHFVDSAGAQQSKPSPRLTPLLGVYDAESGKPIEGAVVRDTLGNSAMTTKDGAVALNYVQPMITKKGWYYLIEIRKENYSPLHLEISADSLGDRTEMLVPNPLGGDSTAWQLPAVVTIAKVSITNLEAHGRAGAKIIPQGMLRTKEYESIDIGEALRKNGISIFDLKAQLDPAKRIRGGRSQESCPVRVLLNGSPIGADMQVRYDDQASRYDGVEYYKPHTDVPSEFKQLTNPCGVIIFWTQAR